MMKNNDGASAAVTVSGGAGETGGKGVCSLRKIFPDGLTGLIFDCDGVLFDSKDANVAYYNLALSRLGLPPLTPEEAAWAHMASSLEVFGRMAGHLPLERVKAAVMSTSYHEGFMQLMRPMPGMFDFLDRAARAGLRLALCTNRSDSVRRVLEYFNLPYFNPVMTVTHAPPKPAPDGLLSIIASWGADTGRVGYVGDSLVDQQAGDAAGIPLIAFMNPDLTARLHVAGYEELACLLPPGPERNSI